MRTPQALIVVVVVGSVFALAMSSAPLQAPQFTSDFSQQLSGNLQPNSKNRYFPMSPGDFRRYEGMEDGEHVVLEITTLGQVKNILFPVNGHMALAITRIIQEKEWHDGELVEVSKNYFACNSKTGDVFYFGESVDFYENGHIANHNGSWRAGQAGAAPGLVMPGLFLLGSRYLQEVAPGVALDRATHVRQGLHVVTPAGTFNNCVKIEETSALEPDAMDTKIYAPGIGLIADDTLKLVAYHVDDDD